MYLIAIRVGRLVYYDDTLLILYLSYVAEAEVVSSESAKMIRGIIKLIKSINEQANRSSKAGAPSRAS